MKKFLILLFAIIFIGGLGMAMTDDSPPPLLKLHERINKDSVLPQAPPVINNPAPPVPPSQSVNPPVPPPPAPPQQPTPPLPEIYSNNVRVINYSTAEKAISAARRAKPYFTAGKVWLWREPGGEVVFKGGIVYQGAVIGVIEFNPSTGEPLPKGFKPYLFNASKPIENIRKLLPTIVNQLQVLPGAEYRAPESCWVIPLSYKSMIVAHIKIFYDGEHVVPDYPANQEMNYYGR